MKTKISILTTLTFVMLTGCASAPKYELPVNAPTATVEAKLQAKSSRNSSTEVKFMIDNIPYPMFYTSSLKPKEFSPITLQANKPIIFLYEQQFVNQLCTIRLNATLEPNKTYTVIDDTSFGKGLFNTGIFANKYCHFGIVDNQTGELIGEYQK